MLRTDLEVAGLGRPNVCNCWIAQENCYPCCQPASGTPHGIRERRCSPDSVPAIGHQSGAVIGPLKSTNASTSVARRHLAMKTKSQKNIEGQEDPATFSLRRFSGTYTLHRRKKI